MLDFFLVFLSLTVLLILVDLVFRHPFIALRVYFGPAHFYYERSPLIPKTVRHTPGVDVQGGVTGNLSYILGRKAKGEPVRFATDRCGYRNIVRRHAAPPDTLILGNCFVNASKTDQDAILAAQLERMGYRCYTMAVDSINLWQEVVNLKFHLETNPELAEIKRIIWAIFEGNDLEGEFWPETDPDQVVAGGGKRIAVALENYYKRSVLRRLFKMIFLRQKPHGVVLRRNFFGQEMLFFEPYVQMLAQTDVDVRKHQNFASVQKIFAAMGEFAGSRGLDVLCMFIPVKPRVYEWVLRGEAPWTEHESVAPFAGLVEEFCRQHGFAFLDTTTHLIRRARQVYMEKGEVLYWLDDTHWNHEGIGVAVEQVDRLFSWTDVN